MYQAMINSPVTTLASSIDTTQTNVGVTDGNKLPEAPNLATLGAGENAETILYTGKTGNTLTGVTRGFQGTTKAWSAGTQIGRFFTAYDHDTFVKNIKDHTSDTNNPHGVTPAQIGAETPKGAQDKADKAKTDAINASVKKAGDTMTGRLNAPTISASTFNGRELIAGDWADISDNIGGAAVFGNNVYTGNGNDFYYANTHGTIGARAIRLSISGVEFFDTGLVAATAGQLITPVWYPMWHGGNSGPFFRGTGSPEGAISAPVGAIYQRTDGGTNTTLYVKQSNAGGNTGWVAK